MSERLTAWSALLVDVAYAVVMVGMLVVGLAGDTVPRTTAGVARVASYEADFVIPMSRPVPPAPLSSFRRDDLGPPRQFSPRQDR